LEFVLEQQSKKHIERPLSPHLTIYKPQISSVLSIAHRISGVALSVFALIFGLTGFLYSIASGAKAYDEFVNCISSPLTMLVFFGLTFMLFYHLCNGIRHLMWDAGHGFDIPTMTKTGYAVIGLATTLTVITWIAILALL
jgi:succinate dehydrogenase / fumarate reductase cytochrome b subunit